MANRAAPARLFLDTGVMIEGCTSRWGASKAVLIHATQRDIYTVILAEAVERELQRNVGHSTGTTGTTAAELTGWMRRIRLERWPTPPVETIRRHAPILVPALRHLNDLPAAVIAIQAQPDWVISANSEHWGQALAQRTGLRIVTPQEFIGRLRPS